MNTQLSTPLLRAAEDETPVVQPAGTLCGAPAAAARCTGNRLWRTAPDLCRARCSSQPARTSFAGARCHARCAGWHVSRTGHATAGGDARRAESRWCLVAAGSGLATRERLQHMLGVVAPTVLITSGELRERCPSGAHRLFDLDQEQAQIAAQPATDPQLPIAPEQLCYLMFTSGSAGAPKCVMVTHGNLAGLFPPLSVRHSTSGPMMCGAGFIPLPSVFRSGRFSVRCCMVPVCRWYPPRSAMRQLHSARGLPIRA
jgi:hypothetical protein